MVSLGRKEFYLDVSGLFPRRKKVRGEGAI